MFLDAPTGWFSYPCCEASIVSPSTPCTVHPYNRTVIHMWETNALNSALRACRECPSPPFSATPYFSSLPVHVHVLLPERTLSIWTPRYFTQVNLLITMFHFIPCNSTCHYLLPRNTECFLFSGDCHCTIAQYSEVHLLVFGHQLTTLSMVVDGRVVCIHLTVAHLGDP